MAILEFREVIPGFVVETGYQESPTGQRIKYKPRFEDLRIYTKEDAEAYPGGARILPSQFFNSSEAQARFTDNLEFIVKVPEEVEGSQPNDTFVLTFGQSDLLNMILNLQSSGTPLLPQNSSAMLDAYSDGLITIEDQNMVGTNSWIWSNTMTNVKKLKFKRLYATSKKGTFEDIKPEVYRFDIFGNRLLNIDSADKKNFRERTKEDNNNLAHSIEGLNVTLDGLTSLVFRIKKGEEVTFKIGVELIW